MKICLVGCVKTQEKDENKKYMAEKLYKSRIYNRCLQEAKRQKPDRIYILSTKYGLLHLDEQIFPYNFPALGISYNDHQTKDRKFRKECKQK
jgi:hypothetical protein